MVLSSLLQRSSRTFREPQVLAATKRIAAYGCRLPRTHTLDIHCNRLALPIAGLRRPFWDWRGAGQDGRKGEDGKGKDGKGKDSKNDGGKSDTGGAGQSVGATRVNEEWDAITNLMSSACGPTSGFFLAQW